MSIIQALGISEKPINPAREMRWTDEQIKQAEAMMCERLGEDSDGYYAELVERMLDVTLSMREQQV